MLVNACNSAGEQCGANEFCALAVLRFGAEAQLVEAAEVDFDRSIDFWEDAPLVLIRQGETALWLRATHHNSSEGFHSYFLIGLIGNRLRLILDEPPGLMNARLCG